MLTRTKNVNLFGLTSLLLACWSSTDLHVLLCDLRLAQKSTMDNDTFLDTSNMTQIQILVELSSYYLISTSIICFVIIFGNLGTLLCFVKYRQLQQQRYALISYGRDSEIQINALRHWQHIYHITLEVPFFSSPYHTWLLWGPGWGLAG